MKQLRSQYNSLMNFEINIPKPVQNLTDIVKVLNDTFNDYFYIYAYTIYIRANSYNAKFIISKNQSYNTIPTYSLATQIYDTITKPRHNKAQGDMIGYKQPPLSVLYDAYTPLINSLVHKQKQKWNDLEIDDLRQICAMTMTRLYNEGYYIHRRLLDRAFSNAVLMSIRKDKQKPIFVSYDEPIGTDGNLTLADTIVDISAEDRLEQILGDTTADLRQCQMKIIIDMIGERQFNQLVFEYANKCTTKQSAAFVHRLKTKLLEKGVTTQSIINKILEE